MRPPKSTVVLAALLVILSYSITVACDHNAEQAQSVVRDADVVSEADAGSIDVTVTCQLIENALTHGIFVVETGQCSTMSRAATVTHSIRAGVNLTRTLSRAMAHMAVAMARTAYHTVTALT